MKSTRLIIPALSLAATTLLVAQGQPEISFAHGTRA